MLEEINHIRYVYHYTSLETLFAILENYRKSKDKKGLVFRASNIFKVNDPTEMKRGYEVVKTLLPQYEIKRVTPEIMRLSEVYQTEEWEKQCKEDYFESVCGTNIEIGTVPYVISFSAKKDYLPMWSLYGNRGKGVCLKFDIEKLIGQEHVRIGFVAYNMNTIHRSFKENISFLYDLIMRPYISEGKPLTIEKKISELSTICFDISPFIKYKDYQYEKEFRLVGYKNYGIIDSNDFSIDPMLLYPSKIEVDPYIEIPIPACSLTGIILGPCMDVKVMRHVIKNEIHSCNLKMRVSKSNIPFRLK